MKLKNLVLRQMLKNMKHYYLYFFALIFSVTLYFAFATLQFNGEVLTEIEDSSSAKAGFEVATYLLWFIVLVFVLYANHLFMRRRSKEIGMYQLIGMTKGLVFRLLALENAILFIGAVLLGVVSGFLGSRLFAMILVKVIGENMVVGMNFSIAALVNTLIVFGILLLFILGQLFVFIRRQTLLQMFHSNNQADESVRKFNWWQMLLGLIGLALIIYGYMKSTQLFEGQGDELGQRMIIVLVTTILGTFLIFRYSVALLINVWRARKNGHVSRGDVVALLPIMHRMKSNAKSLTLIAVLTAVSLGVNTLAYISYYSSEQMVIHDIPSDYVVVNDKADAFESLLEKNNIEYERKDFSFKNMTYDFPELLENREDEHTTGYDFRQFGPVVPASEFNLKLKDNEAYIYGFNGYSTGFISVKKSGMMDLYEYTADETIRHSLNVLELSREPGLQTLDTNATAMTLVVSDELYEKIEIDSDNMTGYETHFNLKNADDELVARELFKRAGANVYMDFEDGSEPWLIGSQQQELEDTREVIGLIIFITAFLGLAFLIASGSILYFKQMSEAEQEKGSYTILRKIGYSEKDLMSGIYKKQLFNFGVPTVVGLFHSYFAVKSGWWFFGTEFMIPMITMMILYVIIYSGFALLTVLYYKKIVKAAL